MNELLQTPAVLSVVLLLINTVFKILISPKTTYLRSHFRTRFKCISPNITKKEKQNKTGQEKKGFYICSLCKLSSNAKKETWQQTFQISHVCNQVKRFQGCVSVSATAHLFTKNKRWEWDVPLRNSSSCTACLAVAEKQRFFSQFALKTLVCFSGQVTDTCGEGKSTRKSFLHHLYTGCKDCWKKMMLYLKLGPPNGFC